MRVVVLGATGGVGKEMVGQAVERGHTVTVFVRNAMHLNGLRNRVQVIQGDLLNAGELTNAIRGQDCVLSGFGPRLPIVKADSDLLRRFAATLNEAMRKAGVARAVVVSTAFLFKDAVFPPAYLLGRLLFPGVVTDSEGMEDVLTGSGLAWTIVRPPRLTDGPRTGKYRVRDSHLPAFGFSISRADVADFMIEAAENSGSIGKIMGISK